MEHQAAPKTLDHEATKPKPLLPLAFANGVLKKNHQQSRPPPPTLTILQPSSPSNQDQQRFVYRECLKNHAAALGGHALDGCGEFMPSPDSNPSYPTTLTCAACGCHRNFHRRLQGGFLKQHHRRDNEERDEEEDEEEQEEGEDHSSPTQFYSAPHMLLALSGGMAGGAVGADPNRAIATTGGSAAGALVTGSGTVLPRKRFRSKFRADQKEKMQELSERLGWRMQKRDEGLVEECCREIGVGRGVFKVWMHNNKHHFCASTRRGELPAATSGGGGGCVNNNTQGGVEVIGDGRNENSSVAVGNGVNNGDTSSHVVNGGGSSSS